MSTTVQSARKRQTLGGPAQVVISSTRGPSTRMSMGGGTVTMRSSNVVRSSIAPPTYAKGTVAGKTRTAVEHVLQGKDKEKKELNSLNMKLAETLQASGYLKSQVQLLSDQVEKLKKEKCPDIEDLRAEYEDELQGYKDALAAAKKTCAEFEPKLVGLKEELQSKDEEINMLRRFNKELEDKLKMITNTIGDLEGEIKSMRLNLDNQQTLNEQKQAEIDRLRNDLDNARTDLEHAREEQMNYAAMMEECKADAEFEADCLNKTIDLLRQEVETLKRCQPDVKKEWDTSFRTVMKQIQDAYDSNLNDRVALIERQYSDRVRALELAQPKDKPDSGIAVKESRELKSKLNNTLTDAARLQRELDDLRAKYQELLNRYDENEDKHELEIEELKAKIIDQQEDLDENMKEIDELERRQYDLQAEIDCYRRLLEGGDASLRSALQSAGNVQSDSGAMLSSIIGSGGSGGSASQSSNPEVSKPKTKAPASGPPASQKNQTKPAMQTSTGRVNLKRRCRGALQFSEVKMEGSYCELENTGSTEIDLTDYTVKRDNAKGKEVVFPMPKGQKIPGRSKLRIYAFAFEDEAEESPCPKLIAKKVNVNNWGVGNGKFVLLDGKQAEKASAEMIFS